MGFKKLEEKWAEQEAARTEKLLQMLSANEMSAKTKDYVTDLSKEFSPHDVTIPSPVTPMPEVSRDFTKLDLMRIIIKQNFMIIKQLETISQKLDK